MFLRFALLNAIIPSLANMSNDIGSIPFKQIINNNNN